MGSTSGSTENGAGSNGGGGGCPGGYDYENGTCIPPGYHGPPDPGTPPHGTYVSQGEGQVWVPVGANPCTIFKTASGMSPFSNSKPIFSINLAHSANWRTISPARCLLAATADYVYHERGTATREAPRP